MLFHEPERKVAAAYNRTIIKLEYTVFNFWDNNRKYSVVSNKRTRGMFCKPKLQLLQ